MAKFDKFVHILGRYKIVVALLIGAIVCGVLCDTSVLAVYRLHARRRALSAELERYRARENYARQQLDALRTSGAAVERVAREKYFMKYDDEDIFIFHYADDAEEQPAP